MKLRPYVTTLFVLALFWMFAPTAKADGGTLLVSGTTVFGGGVETITISFELQSDMIVPGTVDINAIGPVSFAGATYEPASSSGFGCGFNQWNSTQPSSFLQVTFYEDGYCTATGQPQVGSVGLVYFQCGPSDGCPFVISDFEGFVDATEAPEPNGVLLLGAGLAVLVLFRFWNSRGVPVRGVGRE
jgi:hypothetical protein